MSASFKWCKDKTKLAICGKQVFYFTEHGDKVWCMNGVFHRENGPAIEISNWYKEWYLNGTRYEETTYWKKLKRIKK